MPATVKVTVEGPVDCKGLIKTGGELAWRAVGAPPPIGLRGTPCGGGAPSPAAVSMPRPSSVTFATCFLLLTIRMSSLSQVSCEPTNKSPSTWATATTSSPVASNLPFFTMAFWFSMVYRILSAEGSDTSKPRIKGEVSMILRMSISKTLISMACPSCVAMGPPLFRLRLAKIAEGSEAP